MIILKWLLVCAALGYLGALAVLFFMQRSLVFPVPVTGRTVPAAADFPEAAEHVLSTADGERVIVWHVPPQPGHPVVLYFPGNGDYLAGSVGRFRNITADGTGLIALSYRGYAGSSGRPSEQGLLQDAEAAYAFAVGHYEAGRIVAWGFSLGSGVAVALAARHVLGRLILEAPYTSIADVAASLPRFRWAPVRLLLRDPFHSDQRIAAVTVPLLIIHGGRDAVVAIGFGERLFALAQEPKQLVRLAEGGHNDLDNYGAIETARHFLYATDG